MRLRSIAVGAVLVLASCSGERRAPDVPAPPESAPLVSTAVANPSNAPPPPPRAMQSRTIGYDGQVSGGAAHASSGSDTTAPAAQPTAGRFWAPTTPATGNMNPSPPDTTRQGRWAPTTPATGNMNPSPPGP